MLLGLLFRLSQPLLGVVGSSLGTEIVAGLEVVGVHRFAQGVLSGL